VAAAVHWAHAVLARLSAETGRAITSTIDACTTTKTVIGTSREGTVFSRVGGVTYALATLAHTVAVAFVGAIFDTAIRAVPARKADTVALVTETLTRAIIQTLFELTSITLVILVTTAKTRVVVAVAMA
jgi:hypothetical protein